MATMPADPLTEEEVDEASVIESLGKLSQARVKMKAKDAKPSADREESSADTSTKAVGQGSPTQFPRVQVPTDASPNDKDFSHDEKTEDGVGPDGDDDKRVRWFVQLNKKRTWLTGTFTADGREKLTQWLRLWRRHKGDNSSLPPCDEEVVSLRHGAETIFTRDSLWGYLNDLEKSHGKKYSENIYIRSRGKRKSAPVSTANSGTQTENIDFLRGMQIVGGGQQNPYKYMKFDAGLRYPPHVQVGYPNMMPEHALPLGMGGNTNFRGPNMVVAEQQLYHNAYLNNARMNMVAAAGSYIPLHLNSYVPSAQQHVGHMPSMQPQFMMQQQHNQLQQVQQQLR